MSPSNFNGNNANANAGAVGVSGGADNFNVNNTSGGVRLYFHILLVKLIAIVMVKFNKTTFSETDLILAGNMLYFLLKKL